MKCEDCKKEKAQKTFTQIINNEKTILHLCNACAEKRGFHKNVKGETHSFGVENLVSKIANEYEEEKDAVTCDRCGLKYMDFKQSGRLGCGYCYTAFGTRLDDLLRKIHGSNYHIGKMPKNIAPAISHLKKPQSCGIK
jgi:protein arginine kinase activator